jgi:pimeloyl-ACP methyl ester carboxylesterase
MNPTERHECGADSVLIMLPGALMTPQHMVAAGLLAEVQRRALALDVIAPDLHAEGADNRLALRALEADWLAPARARYRRVWLGGISRGGQLALSCLAGRQGEMHGLCLLAPYAGGRITTNAIRRAGGLAAWQAGVDLENDPDVRLWHWLKQPLPEVPVFMGYGEQDRFADGMQMLAQQLPQARHATVPGEHDWAAWLPLWQGFLDLGHFEVEACRDAR